MKTALAGLSVTLVVACGAFGGSDPDPEPAPVASAEAGAEGGTDASTPNADASRPAVSVSCEGVGPCEGSHAACCSSGVAGSTNTCNAPGKCPSDQPHAYLCDDASDCVGAGFPEGTPCCGTLRSDGAVFLGSACMPAGACPASTLELCQPGAPATSMCTRGTACLPNTKKVPTLYAYCQ